MKSTFLLLALFVSSLPALATDHEILIQELLENSKNTGIPSACAMVFIRSPFIGTLGDTAFLQVDVLVEALINHYQTSSEFQSVVYHRMSPGPYKMMGTAAEVTQGLRHYIYFKDAFLLRDGVIYARIATPGQRSSVFDQIFKISSTGEITSISSDGWDYHDSFVRHRNTTEGWVKGDGSF